MTFFLLIAAIANGSRPIAVIAQDLELPKDTPAAEAPAIDTSASVADQRMQVMQTRALAIKFDSDHDGFPESLDPKALFRYDDIPRGYVDGAIWRLGEHGRPKVIITTELHKDFFGAGPKIIYEFLSLTQLEFQASSKDFTSWMPEGSETAFKQIDQALPPASTAVRRLQQMKILAKRFTALQVVEGQKVVLRRLPQPIGRYQAAKRVDESTENTADESQTDGAIFVFASGRMPGLILLIESDGTSWRYGIGRLSRPSKLTMSLDGVNVWSRIPSNRSWSRPYTSTNASAKVP